jgi:hypothetical protein
LFYNCNFIRLRMLKWEGHVARMVEKRSAFRILAGKPEERQKQLGRRRRRWMDNVKMDLSETGWVGMDLIDLSQDWDQWRALVNTVMNLFFSPLALQPSFGPRPTSMILSE